MAAFDHIHNLYDVSLKPKLLQSFIKEYLPDEKQQLRTSLELSHVLSVIKTHQLLPERVVKSADNKKLIEKWKTAVDLWVNRLLMLVASNMPDKRWAGVSLLGVTCEECSSERFLASYSVWFQKMLSLLQTPAESHFVKVACCHSLSDLLTRLSGFPNMKKDGTSHSAKLLQPVLKLMNEDNADAEGAVSLLYTILTVFPSSVQKNYDAAEVAIVTKLMSGRCNDNMLKKLALCLSLLPTSKGDVDSWNLMIQKIILAINILLNDAFQGLEEETKSKEIMRALVPPGKEPPAPLGGLTMFDMSTKGTKPERLHMPSISALMLCCSTMIKTHRPVQAKVPVQALLMLAERVVMVDGSLTHTLYPTITAMQQLYICSELPFQHSYCLDILCGLVTASRSQLLPYTAHLLRIVTEYLKTCALPLLRVKLYALIKSMLLSLGVGITLFIADDIVNNASVDLNSVSDHGEEASPEAFPQTMQRKRKHEMPNTPHGNQPQTLPTPISVKIAALEALEALLTIGGSLRTEQWRSDVDRILMTVSTNACKNGWINQANNVYTVGESDPNWGDYQLAALRALLASLLSPGRIRPPYLAQSLEYFRSGIRETGTKLAEFCAHALMALEVLIHPRALPVINIEYSVDANTSFAGAQKHNMFSLGTSRNELESQEDDDMYEKYVKDSDEMEALVIEQETQTEKETGGDELVENFVSIGGTSGVKVPDDKGKGILVEAEPVKESENLGQTVDYRVSDNMEIETMAAKDVAGTAGDVEVKGKTAAGRAFETVSGSEGGGEFTLTVGGSDELMDGIPDIVDVEPDSDSD